MNRNVEPFSVGLPSVSVLLAIRNEGKFIARTLTAIIDQTYPTEKMEIVIADGLSTDETRDIVRSFESSHKHIVLLDNPGKIVSTGLNLALNSAHGDVIVRVDGHTVIEHDYVEQCVAALSRTRADNVGGRMNAVGERAVARAISCATSSPFGVGGGRFHYSEAEEWADTVYMGAWPRSVFDRVGGFDEEMVRNQDDEFNYRLRELGGRILLSPLIKSEYYNRSSFSKLWSQYFQYGYWKVRVMQKHPRQMQWRQFVPAAFVFSLLVFGAGSFLFPWSRVIGSGIVALYLIANLSASIIAGLKGNVRSFYLLPICFAILHVSYGLGFLKGLVHFRKKWGGGRQSVIEFKMVRRYPFLRRVNPPENGTLGIGIDDYRPKER